MSRTIWVGAVAYDPKVVTIWEGMRRYFHEEARLPVEVVLFQSYEAQVIALLAAPGDPIARIDIAWKPAPSSVSWASGGTAQSASVIGADALALSPMPSQGPETDKPSAPAGTR